MRRHVAIFFSVAMVAAAFDLVSKHYAFAHVEEYEEVKVIDGWFSFVRTVNTGVVWGLGRKFPGLWLVVAVLAVPAITAIFFSVKKPKWILTIVLGMILGGTIGNMYDRIFHPGVRDLIKCYYVRADGTSAVWPIFNLADSFICVGVFLLSIEMLFFEEKGKKKDESPKPAAAPPPPATEPGPTTGV